MASEYLNNKMFEAIIDRFRRAQENAEKDKKEFDEAQLELATAFYTLARNIVQTFKFQLVDADDALQEGVLICFEKLHRFDPKIGRAFNFCTTIILNHYRQLYRHAKSHNDFKVRYLEHQYNKLNNKSRKSVKLAAKIFREMNEDE